MGFFRWVWRSTSASDVFEIVKTNAQKNAKWRAPDPPRQLVREIEIDDAELELSEEKER